MVLTTRVAGVVASLRLYAAGDGRMAQEISMYGGIAVDLSTRAGHDVGILEIPNQCFVVGGDGACSTDDGECENVKIVGGTDLLFTPAS